MTCVDCRFNARGVEDVLVAAAEHNYLVVLRELFGADDADVVAEDLGYARLQSIDNLHGVSALHIPRLVVLVRLHAEEYQEDEGEDEEEVQHQEVDQSDQHEDPEDKGQRP